MAALSREVDFFTVMTYDYHGSWETLTGHVSPLYGDDNDKYPQYNTDYALQLLVKLGAEKDKIVVGVPFYGQVRDFKHFIKDLKRNCVIFKRVFENFKLFF